MNNYSNPDILNSTVKLIQGLSPVVYERVLSALKVISPSSSLSTLFDELKTQFESPHSKEIFESLRYLVSYTNEESDYKIIASELTENYFKNVDQSLSKISLKELNSRIFKVLENSATFKMMLKAAYMLTDGKNVFYESRIYSDVRLSFQDDITDKNRFGVIIHQLKLTYTADRKIKDFYLSLDKRDLFELKRSIERAIEKDTLINQDYNKTISFVKIDG